MSSLELHIANVHLKGSTPYSIMVIKNATDPDDNLSEDCPQ